MKRTCIYLLSALVCSTALGPMTDKVAAAAPFNFNIVSGSWTRSDADYTLHVGNVSSDGSVAVTYFNPAEIHVSESHVSTQEGLVKIYVKLEDDGYPGCTYTLYYYAEEDALAGFYYQAAMNQTFEVVFLRENPE